MADCAVNNPVSVFHCRRPSNARFMNCWGPYTIQRGWTRCPYFLFLSFSAVALQKIVYVHTVLSIWHCRMLTINAKIVCASSAARATEKLYYYYLYAALTVRVAHISVL